MNCFACQFDDCINDTITADEIKASERADKELTDLADRKQIEKREYVKKYNAENRERIRAYKKQYYQKNKQKCCDAVCKWQKANKEYRNAYAREWYATKKAERVS